MVYELYMNLILKVYLDIVCDVLLLHAKGLKATDRAAIFDELGEIMLRSHILYAVIRWRLPSLPKGLSQKM